MRSHHSEENLMTSGFFPTHKGHLWSRNLSLMPVQPPPPIKVPWSLIMVPERTVDAAVTPAYSLDKPLPASPRGLPGKRRQCYL